MVIVMPLPTTFYTAQQVKQGEVQAAKARGLEMFSLMERAGQGVFTIALAQYPSSQHWLVCCGGGNNGGDGYIAARLAKAMGHQVTVWQVGNPEKLKGDALTAYYHWLDQGGDVYPIDDHVPRDVDLIIDGLLGTGLSGPVREPISDLIDTINNSGKPVVAIDIPSGLSSNTGSVLGKAIKAQHTISFIGLKQGLVTGQARNYVGKLHFAGLGVSENFDEQNTPTLKAIEPRFIRQCLKPRQPCAHKGHHGKAVLIGGNRGMGGAMMLCAQACTRIGSGLTGALVHSDNMTAMLTVAPEVMTGSWEVENLKQRTEWCNVIGLGPGLGRGKDGRAIFEQVQSIDKPKVLDADALFFLAENPNHDDKRIITPHPAEAARLLGASVELVETDRFKAIHSLHEKYGGVIVLKGAGTLIYDGSQTYVCLAGNPGMATGGMGDVLTGIITALLAQGVPLCEAARAGGLVHSQAADKDAELKGERGLLASDLLPHLRSLVNY